MDTWDKAKDKDISKYLTIEEGNDCLLKERDK